MAQTADPLAAIEAKLIETARVIQQNFYEISSDWHRYEQHELNYLRDYIGIAMFGPPQLAVTDENNETDSDENINNAGYFVYEKKHQEAIQLIYDKVLKHANQYDSSGSVFCNVIYNVIFNKEQAQEALLRKKTEWAAMLKENKDKGEEVAFECLEPEVQAYPVPVFKVKQICKQNTEIFEKIYYIDNGGRVYDEFANYLDYNTLPICTMVYPKDGKYQIDQEFHAKLNIANQNIEDLVSVVWLSRRQSPADSTTSKILSGGDIATTIVTVASMGVAVTSLFTPIGPAMALAGGIGGGIGGVWSFGRSVQQLVDRGRHDESISPIEDRSAFSAWMGIAGGAVGLAATGSSALLARAIRTGTTVSRAATLTYDVVLVGNLIVNGVGISFKSYDIYAAYIDNKEISLVDVSMLVGHLFFFGNSVMNMRFAQTVIESSQAQLLKDYEASLRSNRHRKEFQRMARNTRAAGTNDISSNEEIIRGINKIANKDEFFQAMVRNRKSLSASSARAAFSDGKVTVNSLLTIDPIEFANLPKDVRTEIIRNVANSRTDSSAGINTNNSPGVSNTLSRVNAANFGSKPTDLAGIQPKGSGEAKPNHLAQQKPNNSAGVKSNNMAETQPKSSDAAKPNNPAEPKPNESAAVKPNNVAGTQAKDSRGAKLNNSMKPTPVNFAGIEPNDPSESTSNVAAKPKLKSSSGVPASDSVKTKSNNSPGVPKESAGSESNVPTGTKLKDLTRGIKPNKTDAGVGKKIQPNETLYKNFDTRNGVVLNEFCTKHASAMFQMAPPEIADFANVLRELRSVQNYAIIFGKLLEIAYKIFQNLPRDEEIVLGNVLGCIVEFLWNYLKACIRYKKPGIPIADPLIRTCLDGGLQELWVSVEERIAVWVKAFKEWLKQKFPQSLRISR